MRAPATSPHRLVAAWGLRSMRPDCSHHSAHLGHLVLQPHLLQELSQLAMNARLVLLGGLPARAAETGGSRPTGTRSALHVVEQEQGISGCCRGSRNDEERLPRPLAEVRARRAKDGSGQRKGKAVAAPSASEGES